MFASFCASATSTTIVSNAFAAGSVPTTSRIVVFEENVATPTLNTDIIASVSRDGGSNFTTATLSDSGYVTGSSGQRILTGTVVSSNTNKTIVVKVTRRVQHKLYKKIISQSKRYHAHDENNSFKVGDIVKIIESKPISKLKSWTVVNDNQEKI